MTGSVVYEEPRPVGDRLELLERDVEAVADRIGAGLDERVPAAERVPVERGEVERHALAGVGPRHRLVVHLDAPDTYVEPARLGAELVAGTDRPGPERPGDYGADPAQREDPVNVQARRAEQRLPLDRPGRGGECRPKLLESGARLRAHGHDVGLRHELSRLLERELERLLVDCVGLRDGDDSAPDPE